MTENNFGRSTLDNIERERERLAAVERYDVLDTPREEAFDRITRLAQKVFDVPIAVVNIIDAHRTWHKSCVGVSGDESAREHAFSSNTICQNDPLIVIDATKDPRFAQNPHVLTTPGVCFYQGFQAPPNLALERGYMANECPLWVRSGRWSYWVSASA